MEWLRHRKFDILEENTLKTSIFEKIIKKSPYQDDRVLKRSLGIQNIKIKIKILKWP
jgi:hypothetical protein